MALTSFGEQTKSIFLNEVEGDKLHLAFEATTVVKKGQPVMMSGDDTIAAATAGGADNYKVIGYSIQDGKVGDQVTVAMRGYAVIWAMSGAALAAGPVTYNGVNGGDARYTNYITEATPAEVSGISLDTAAAANEMIRVVLQ